MLYLADFSVMNPSFGLLFWTSIIFILVWLVIGRFFKSIKNALKDRETDIQSALDQAKLAREEMAQLKSEHDVLLKKAREERLKIIADAEAAREQIVEEAKAKADQSSRQMIEAAKQEIENRRKEMEVELFNELGQLSVHLAEQLIGRELENKHEDFIQSKVTELKNTDLAQLN